MSHDYHEGLPGFHESQILHDGCAECEHRGSNPVTAIDALDPQNFERAWYRAEEWNKHGLENIADAEMPLLRVLNAVQYQLQLRGVRSLPSGVSA